jgi:hypothetical protein
MLAKVTLVLSVLLALGVAPAALASAAGDHSLVGRGDDRQKIQAGEKLVYRPGPLRLEDARHRRAGE